MKEICKFADDLLDLRAFSERLEKFIKVDHRFVQGSLVIALSSKFGFGKTTFLKMWKSKLECSEEKWVIVELNAWESDYYGDPLFAIVSSLVASLKNSKLSKEKNKLINKLTNAVQDAAWLSVELTMQLIRKQSGIDLNKAKDFVSEKRNAREALNRVPMDAFSVYQSRKDSMTKLQGGINEFVTDNEQIILFLVDELDRCRPDYAISYLETIKHIFNVQGTVFILAADRRQLENSAKKAFGQNLDFDEYYRKFIHREVTLPPITEPSYKKLAESYVNYYLEQEGLRSCCVNIRQVQTEKIIELVGALKLTPRQIQEVFRIAGHILGFSEEERGGVFPQGVLAVFAMAVFKVGNPGMFHLLGSGEYDPEKIGEFCTNLNRPGDNEKTKRKKQDIWLKFFQNCSGLPPGREAILWGSMTMEGFFHRVHRQIEQLSEWDYFAKVPPRYRQNLGL
ncbi:hypothetical protein OMCYN_01600 [cyanobiont of Ornithocercus magnificus]|nr:hypothetical protein OMCYN_01600 [cyanobiont of Ornithocercus magnificus]